MLVATVCGRGGRRQQGRGRACDNHTHARTLTPPPPPLHTRRGGWLGGRWCGFTSTSRRATSSQKGRCHPSNTVVTRPQGAQSTRAGHPSILFGHTQGLGRRGDWPRSWCTPARPPPTPHRPRGGGATLGGSKGWAQESVSILKQACSPECQGAQGAFKDSMIHGILQFTLRIAFRCVLHRCESQEIRCQKLFFH